MIQGIKRSCGYQEGACLQPCDADPNGNIEGEGGDQQARRMAAAVEAAQLAGQEEGQIRQPARAPGCVPCGIYMDVVQLIKNV